MRTQLTALALAILLLGLLAFSPDFLNNHTDLAAVNAPSTKIASEARIKTLNDQLARPASVAPQDLLKVAEERRVAMTALAQEDAPTFLRLALTATQRAALPPAVQDLVERPISETGVIGSLHVDDFEHRRQTDYLLFLTTANHQSWRLYPTGPGNFSLGSKVRVDGLALNDFIVVNQLATIANAPNLPTQTGVRRLLVIPFGFSDSGPPFFTPDQIREAVFNGQFNRFYTEQSYNQISFAGDVTENIVINQPTPCVGCRFSDWPQVWPPNGSNGMFNIPEISRYLVDHEINLDNYYGVVFLFNRSGIDGAGYIGPQFISFGGQAYSPTLSWVQGWGISTSNTHLSDLGFVLAHEVGHNLGLPHANGWDCDTSIWLASGCNAVVYGNSYDAMGTGGFAQHFSAYAKELLGWFRAQTNSLVITQSGTYTLTPLEVDNDGPKLAKIRLSNGDTPFYIEYRRAIGFDSDLNNPLVSNNQNGLFVYHSDPELVDEDINQWPPYYTSYPHLLDMSPTPAAWNIGDAWQLTLNGNNEFTWQAGEQNITIGPILSANVNAITFQATFGGPTFQWWSLY